MSRKLNKWGNSDIPNILYIINKSYYFYLETCFCVHHLSNTYWPKHQSKKMI